jgi:hypothetical protein
MADKKNLSEILSLLGDLSSGLSQSGPKADKQLKDTLAALKPALQGFVEAAGKPEDKVREALVKTVDFDQGTELRDFFQNVAGSLIEAQTKLDDESFTYSQTALAKNLPPARFAIPTVKAELRFGFSNITSKGLNVFVYSNQEQSKKQSESSISFDIVATAPEPKRDRLPSIDPRREAILDLFFGLVPNQNLAALKNGRDFAAVFEYTQSPTPRFLVIWPTKAGNIKNPAIWTNILVGCIDNGKLTLDLFDKDNQSAAMKSDGVLLLSNTSELKALSVDDLVRLSENLGDTLMNLCLIANPAAAAK